MEDLVQMLSNAGGVIARNAMFFIAALTCCLGAILVVFTRKVVHTAFALLLCFIGVTAIYVFLSADFLAAVQILIYVGAVLVLMLFGIMLTGPEMVHREDETTRTQWLMGAVTFAVVFWMLFHCVKPSVTDWNLSWQEVTVDSKPTLQEYHVRMKSSKVVVENGADAQGEILVRPSDLPGHGNTTASIARKFLTDYLLPFEIISVVLLAALVGGVMLSRGHKDE